MMKTIFGGVSAAFDLAGRRPWKTQQPHHAVSRLIARGLLSECVFMIRLESRESRHGQISLCLPGASLSMLKNAGEFTAAGRLWVGSSRCVQKRIVQFVS
jgi:hypothetical protein